MSYPWTVDDQGEPTPVEDWSRLEDDERPDLPTCDEDL